MIDFACKKFYVEDIVRCSFNLTKTEFKIFQFMVKNSAKKFSTNNIANSLNIDVSTVQRSMKKMHEKNIVRRSQINLEAGYNFVYCICDKYEIKKSVKDIIKNWTNKFDKEIEKW